MKNIINLLIVHCFLYVFVQNQVYAQNDAVIMKIGKEQITLSEFKNTYLKNNDLNKTTEQDLREYIDLYINFRLKYAEALDFRLDTIGALQNELEGYRSQAARSYLTDKEVNDRLLEEVIERMQWDVRASHIMKKLPLDASPKDTLKVYQEMIKIRERILKGESFAAVAEIESDDYSARDRRTPEGKLQQRGNKGDLGYFTVFNMIYDFETAAYQLEIGDISMPVRTNFGYHIVYLQDKKPALGRCAASQILIAYPSNATREDSIKTKEKAMEAYRALKNGMEFTMAVQTYCTDKGIVERKGELPLFTVSRFEGDFIKHLYGLKENEFTEPFETSYGFHIVKLTDRIPVMINADTRAIAKNRIIKDSRSNVSKEAFVEKLKKEYKFKETRNKTGFVALEEFYAIDSSIFDGEWKAATVASWNKPLFRIAEKVYTQKDFAAYLEENQYQNVKNVNLDELINFNYKHFVLNTMMEYEDVRLEIKYPEFANLMKEYKEGVLLYELSERKVWKKAEIDSSGLAAFYEGIKNDYLYPIRVQANIYSISDEANFSKWDKMLKKGMAPKDALSKINKKSERVTVENVIRWKGQDDEFDNLFNWNQWNDVVKEAQNGNGSTLSLDYSMQELRDRSMHKTTLKFIEFKEVKTPSPKPLEEVKGMIISLYQNYLEEQWIKDLRSSNEVWVDYDRILSLIKQ